MLVTALSSHSVAGVSSGVYHSIVRIVEVAVTTAVRTNTPASGGISVTITGFFSRARASFVTRTGATGCEVTEWTSATTLGCKLATIVNSGRPPVVATVASVPHTTTHVVTIDDPRVNVASLPPPSSASVMVTVVGAGAARSAAGVVGLTAGERSTWVSWTSMRAKLPQAVGLFRRGPVAVTVDATEHRATSLTAVAYRVGYDKTSPRNVALSGSSSMTVIGSFGGATSPVGKLGNTCGEASLWFADSTLLLKVPMTRGEVLVGTVVATIGISVLDRVSSTQIVSYDAAKATYSVTDVGNRPSTGSTLVTLYGAGFGYSNCLRIHTSAETTTWLSLTALRSAMPRIVNVKPAFLQATTLRQKAASELRLGQGGLLTSTTKNAPWTGSQIVRLIGTSLMPWAVSGSGRLLGSAAERMLWRSDSSIYIKSISSYVGVVGVAQIIVTATQDSDAMTRSTATDFQFDRPSAVSWQLNTRITQISIENDDTMVTVELTVQPSIDLGAGTRLEIDFPRTVSGNVDGPIAAGTSSAAAGNRRAKVTEALWMQGSHRLIFERASLIHDMDAQVTKATMDVASGQWIKNASETSVTFNVVNPRTVQCSGNPRLTALLSPQLDATFRQPSSAALDRVLMGILDQSLIESLDITQSTEKLGDSNTITLLLKFAGDICPGARLSISGLTQSRTRSGRLSLQGDSADSFDLSGEWVQESGTLILSTSPRAQPLRTISVSFVLLNPRESLCSEAQVTTLTVSNPTMPTTSFESLAVLRPCTLAFDQASMSAISSGAPALSLFGGGAVSTLQTIGTASKYFNESSAIGETSSASDPFAATILWGTVDEPCGWKGQLFSNFAGVLVTCAFWIGVLTVFRCFVVIPIFLIVCRRFDLDPREAYPVQMLFPRWECVMLLSQMLSILEAAVMCIKSSCRQQQTLGWFVFVLLLIVPALITLYITKWQPVTAVFLSRHELAIMDGTQNEIKPFGKRIRDWVNRGLWLHKTNVSDGRKRKFDRGITPWSHPYARYTVTFFWFKITRNYVMVIGAYFIQGTAGAGITAAFIIGRLLVVLWKNPFVSRIDYFLTVAEDAIAGFLFLSICLFLEGSVSPATAAHMVTAMTIFAVVAGITSFGDAVLIMMEMWESITRARKTQREGRFGANIAVRQQTATTAEARKVKAKLEGIPFEEVAGVDGEARAESESPKLKVESIVMDIQDTKEGVGSRSDKATPPNMASTAVLPLPKYVQKLVSKGHNVQIAPVPVVSSQPTLGTGTAPIGGGAEGASQHTASSEETLLGDSSGGVRMGHVGGVVAVNKANTSMHAPGRPAPAATSPLNISNAPNNSHRARHLPNSRTTSPSKGPPTRLRSRSPSPVRGAVKLERGRFVSAQLPAASPSPSLQPISTFASDIELGSAPWHRAAASWDQSPGRSRPRAQQRPPTHGHVGHRQGPTWVARSASSRSPPPPPPPPQLVSQGPARNAALGSSSHHRGRTHVESISMAELRPSMRSPPPSVPGRQRPGPSRANPSPTKPVLHGFDLPPPPR